MSELASSGGSVDVTDGPAPVDGRVWMRACAAVDVPDDEGVALKTLPPVAVFTSDGEFFCLDDTCTHEDYSLAEGWVESCVVECSLHLAKFDLRTGEPLGPPATHAVRTHPTTVVGDDVWVAIPEQYLAARTQ